MNKKLLAALVFFGALLSQIAIYIRACQIGDKVIQVCFWAFIAACWGGYKWSQQNGPDRF
jgi:hypothetical protein